MGSLVRDNSDPLGLGRSAGFSRHPRVDTTQLLRAAMNNVRGSGSSLRGQPSSLPDIDPTASRNRTIRSRPSHHPDTLLPAFKQRRNSEFSDDEIQIVKVVSGKTKSSSSAPASSNGTLRRESRTATIAHPMPIAQSSARTKPRGETIGAVAQEPASSWSSQKAGRTIAPVGSPANIVEAYNRSRNSQAQANAGRHLSIADTVFKSRKRLPAPNPVRETIRNASRPNATKGSAATLSDVRSRDRTQPPNILREPARTPSFQQSIRPNFPENPFITTVLRPRSRAPSGAHREQVRMAYRSQMNSPPNISSIPTPFTEGRILPEKPCDKEHALEKLKKDRRLDCTLLGLGSSYHEKHGLPVSYVEEAWKRLPPPPPYMGFPYTLEEQEHDQNFTGPMHELTGRRTMAPPYEPDNPCELYETRYRKALERNVPLPKTEKQKRKWMFMDNCPWPDRLHLREPLHRQDRPKPEQAKGDKFLTSVITYYRHFEEYNGTSYITDKEIRRELSQKRKSQLKEEKRKAKKKRSCGDAENGRSSKCRQSKRTASSSSESEETDSQEESRKKVKKVLERKAANDKARRESPESDTDSEVEVRKIANRKKKRKVTEQKPVRMMEKSKEKDMKTLKKKVQKKAGKKTEKKTASSSDELSQISSSEESVSSQSSFTTSTECSETSGPPRKLTTAEIDRQIEEMDRPRNTRALLDRRESSSSRSTSFAPPPAASSKGNKKKKTSVRCAGR
ncbi:hypothetical protein L596_002376 [Steinernema carpocapsae]|uniref:Uncharacterized protein n=2 Tax=Steinernema carpocapsae TaxID=34508 RepID=A0A4U8UQ38_STECR|nr:hypothetical protein L596_002376 [Steinernema carpocapsae]